MKNAVKLFLVIAFTAVIVFATAGLTSCGEEGGTIVVENRQYSGISVQILTDQYWGETSQEYIPSGGSLDFAISENGTYWVRVNGNLYKKVSVSGGETVTVTVN